MTENEEPLPWDVAHEVHLHRLKARTGFVEFCYWCVHRWWTRVHVDTDPGGVWFVSLGVFKGESTDLYEATALAFEAAIEDDPNEFYVGE